jgi:diaminopimelate epimerase
MQFYKYHALGNDYIIIDPEKFNFKLTEDNIKLVCHRNFGVGSDGILYGPIFKNGKIGLRIFNPDGSEAEKSGNGLRMFSKYLLDAHYVTEKKFFINTICDQFEAELVSDNPVLIKIDMGMVTFTSNEIPVAGKVREVVNETISIEGENYNITCLSIGNPHCVLILDEISEEKAKKTGPLIELNSLFPNRINVQFVKIIDRNNIQIEIWERGAGYTLASGSSASASATVANKLGLVDNKVYVHMQGGILEIEINSQNHILMSGTVTNVAEGNFSEEMLAKLT